MKCEPPLLEACGWLGVISVFSSAPPPPTFVPKGMRSQWSNDKRKQQKNEYAPTALLLPPPVGSGFNYVRHLTFPKQNYRHAPRRGWRGKVRCLLFFIILRMNYYLSSVPPFGAPSRGLIVSQGRRCVGSVSIIFSPRGEAKKAIHYDDRSSSFFSVQACAGHIISMLE